MRGMARWFKDEQGAAFLEVLLLLPIILVLVFGYIRFTYAARLSTVLQVAAREAAREYAYSNDMGRAIQKARGEVTLGGIDPDDITVRTVKEGAERKVVVEMPYPFHIPFSGKHTPTLFGAAVFKVERSAFF